MSQKQKKFFFTSVPGTDRFLSGDEPTQAVMKDFADSVAFKLEETDTATELQQGLVESATQTEYDTSIDYNGLGYALFVRPSFIKTSLLALETLLQTQIDAINNLIVSIQGDISIMQGEILTIQGDITTLTGAVTTIQENVDNAMPIGGIILWSFTDPPNPDWVECNGASYLTSLYPDLYDVIGTNFGGGGGSFTVPDMRQMFVAGHDPFGPIPYNDIGDGTSSGVGLNEVLLDSTQVGVPAHSHALDNANAGLYIAKGVDHTNDFMCLITAPASASNASKEGRLKRGAKGDASGNPLYTCDKTQIGNDDHGHWFVASTSPGTNFGITFSGSTETDGYIANASSAHENRPPFVVFPYYIKAQ